ncbi:MAG: hypothetical protein ED557_11925 [Balneola sp.]|nr:MAG: hypothetical protein ED557_11925 [Balneola sp.]
MSQPDGPGPSLEKEGGTPYPYYPSLAVFIFSMNAEELEKADEKHAEETGYTSKYFTNQRQQGIKNDTPQNKEETAGNRVLEDNALLDVTEKFDAQLEETRQFFKELASYVDELDIPDWKKYAVKLLLFRKYVNNGATFDIKEGAFSPIELGGNYALYQGEKFRFDDFGNYNYGVAALAFGITLHDAMMGAGINQLKPGRGTPDWKNPRGFFDNRRDTHMIIRGYNHVF